MKQEIKEQFRNSEVFQWLKENYVQSHCDFYCTSIGDSKLDYKTKSNYREEIIELQKLLHYQTNSSIYFFTKNTSYNRRRQTRINFLNVIFKS